jgi:hypothetical protein
MAQIELSDGALVVHVKGFDKVLALAKSFTVPRTHVKGARVGVSQDVWDQMGDSMKMPGAYMPGLAIAGRFVAHGKWMFWDIHKGHQAITIDIDHDSYNHVVVEVDEPEAVVTRIASWVRPG